MVKDEKMEKLVAEVDSLTVGEIEENFPMHPSKTMPISAKSTEYKDESKTESPFTVDVEGAAPTAMEKVHNARTERAQTTDENYNAPVTTNEEKWLENKNRTDYPGVDTIPQQRLGRRAESAAKKFQDMGAVDRVEQKGAAKNLQGKFSPKGRETYGKQEDVVRVQETASSPERTLSHELGHVADFATGEERGFKLSGQLFDLEDSSPDSDMRMLTEQGKQLSERARGDFKGQRDYRNRFEELTADVVSQAILNPRATKREAPELFERLEQTAEEEGFADIFGDESDTLDVF